VRVPRTPPSVKLLLGGAVSALNTANAYRQMPSSSLRATVTDRAPTTSARPCPRSTRRRSATYPQAQRPAAAHSTSTRRHRHPEPGDLHPARLEERCRGRRVAQDDGVLQQRLELLRCPPTHRSAPTHQPLPPRPGRVPAGVAGRRVPRGRRRQARRPLRAGDLHPARGHRRRPVPQPAVAREHEAGGRPGDDRRAAPADRRRPPPAAAPASVRTGRPTG